MACAVVLNDHGDVSVDVLREFAAAKLSAFKVPRQVIKVASIPRGATGKPRRMLLRESLLEAGASALQELPEQSLGAPKAVPPEMLNTTALPTSDRPKDFDKTLEDVWARHLHLDQARPHEDFFSLGGDSLSAVAMLAELQQLFALRTPVSQEKFFQASTLKTLAELVSAEMAGQSHAELSSDLTVVRVSEGRSRPRLFMFPADGEEGSRFRRLSTCLGEEWPLLLLRPKNSWHRRSARSIEEAGAQSAKLIKGVHPKGPYVFGGFCSGGVIAFEAARQLELQGELVLLVLFDVPLPGIPHLVHGWRSFAREFVRRIKLSWSTRSLRPVMAFGRRILRRVLWFAIRATKPSGNGTWALPVFKWVSRQAQAGYFSFYRASATSVPILHFMAQDENDIQVADSRLGWSRVAKSGVIAEWLPGDHDAMFSQENLPPIAESMGRWISSRLADVSHS